MSLFVPDGKGCQEGDLPFPSQRDYNPIALIIRLLLYFGTEADRAHDAIPKLFIQYRLVCKPVILYYLEQSVDEGLFGRHVHGMTSEWISNQLLLQRRVINAQDVRESGDIFRRGLGIAVEYCGNSDFVTAHLLAYLFESHILRGFGIEEGGRLDGETVPEGGLRNGLLASL